MTITKDGIFVSDEHHIIRPYASIGHLVIDSLSNENLSKLVLFVDAASNRQWTGAQLRAKVLTVSTALIDLYDFKRGTCVCIDYDHSDQTIILALAVVFAGGIVACAFPKDPYSKFHNHEATQHETTGSVWKTISNENLPLPLLKLISAELLYLAKKVGPKFLFCHQKNIRWAEKLSKDLNYEVRAVAMDGSPSPHVDHLEKLFNHNDGESPSRSLLPVACVDVNSDIAFITMSSGTTGQPKAIPVTHSMIINDTTGSREPPSDSSKQLVISFTASLDYVSGRIIMMQAIITGFKAVILDCFEPKTMLEAIERYKINVTYLGAASFYNLITYKELERYDISSLISAFPMGAKITYLGELEEFLVKHPHIKLMNRGYGTSETCGIALGKSTPSHFLAHTDNAGKLINGFRAKIVDSNSGKLLGPNEIGMIHVKGPTMFPGYYDVAYQGAEPGLDDNMNFERKTKRPSFIRDSSTFDEDGFYITGDMAYFDENEELYFVGRKKELMICRGAKKVLPSEIELLLSEHPAVLKVCVLGIPNKIEFTLHCPRAYIVVQPICYQPEVDLPLTQPPGSKPSEPYIYKGDNKLCGIPRERRHKLMEDIMEFSNERIGWEKQLTGGLVLVDEMPTLRETGKINKIYLRSLSLDLIEIYGDLSE